MVQYITRLIIGCLLLCALQLKANDYTSIRNVQHQHLAQKAFIFEDESSSFDLEEAIVYFQTGENVFRSEDDVPYMDFTRSTFWMKLEVENDTSIEQEFYIQLARPLTNVVNLYVLDEHGALLQKVESGDEKAFSNRTYINKNFVFPTRFPPHSKRTLLVQTKSDGEILKLPIIFWKINRYTEFLSQENFFLGLYYGLFILVIVLFSFFGLALRQRLYLYFVSYVFSLGLFQFSLDGLSYQYLWSSSPWFGNHAILIFAASSMLFMLFYVRKFLQFSNSHKKYLLFYNVFTGLVALSLLLSFTSGTVYAMVFPLLNGLSFLIVFYFLLGIYLNYKDGQKSELPITAAFLALCISSILFILANVNVINSEFLAANALKLGSAVEVTFLSVAMAIRYRKTQDEKTEAQNIAFESLKELNQLKSEQTEQLEKEVQLRTQEVVDKNNILLNKNEEIINSITYAKRLQDAILPSSKLLEACFNECSIFFKPKDIVSGDFYWVEATKNRVFFAVADCTGHGVPGAMVSVVGHNALNRCINEMKLTDPGEILDRLTNLVEHTFSNNQASVSDGMDICLCSWDYKDEIKYAGAYNPLYILKNNEFSELKGNRQPIGKFEKAVPFQTQSLTVEKGDSIMLFSDGFPDQFGGEKGKKLRYSKFKQILIEANSEPIGSFNDYLEVQLNAWQGKEEQVDDICVMTVRF